jgi:serine protease
MTRVAALLTVALLAAACTPPPVPPGPTGQTVALGTALSGTVYQASEGTWEVEQGSLPAWLKVAPLSGTGTIALSLTADRAQATRTAADQPRLSGKVTVAWKEGTRTGQTTWTVTADQYVLTGRVVDTVKAQGADAGAGAELAAQATPTARGVIVKYRSAAAQAVALGRAAPVGARSEDTQATTRATLKALALKPGALEDLGDRSLHLQTDDVDGALRALRRDPNVEYAVPNAVLRAQAGPVAAPLIPTDQYAGLQWAATTLGYRAVWRDMEAGGYTRPVTVAVIDSGVRFDHPDLAGQVYGPGEGALDVLGFRPKTDKDAYDNGDGDGPDLDPTDPDTPSRDGPGGVKNSHGTHVTGIIAARWGQNAPFADCPECSPSGVVGAAYTAPVKVLPVRVIDAAGSAEVADVIVGLRYAAGLEVTLDGKTYRNPHPAQVINLSLGGDVSAETARPMCAAVAEATRAGALVIAAAGNGYGTSPFYPAACEGAVAVGAVTLSGASAPVHARYSNSYPQVALSAPGGGDQSPATFFNGGQLNGQPYPDVILSTDWDYSKNQPTYMGQSGTSQAAPQVSALAALLLSKGVTQGRDDTLARLIGTATDLGERGRDPQFGYGMINAAAALGAPQVSNVLGLRVESRGAAYQPALDALGRFTAYLPDSTFRVVAGRDRDGNGIPGETTEPRSEREAALGPASPQVGLGDLTPAP